MFFPETHLALLACSTAYSQDVRTNSMPGTDFSKYHRYAWVDEVKGVPRVGGQPDQILEKLVWIGAAQHALEPSKKQEKNQERLNKGAQKLLKDFPPGRKVGISDHLRHWIECVRSQLDLTWG